ncbi:hypothetical protein BJX99DRAFT_239051 [Aspergillus californicus]
MLTIQGPGPILKISQSLEDETLVQPVDPQDTQDSSLADCEEDQEALVRINNTHYGLQVNYDILLSPTYQVPILFFVLRRMDKPLGMEEVYQHLVPNQYKRNIESVGIMGGISFGYHPVSGIPAFFVHPCNTADAMRDIASGHSLSPEAYLIIWLGLVGNCVRLQLPSELFAISGIPKLKCME